MATFPEDPIPIYPLIVSPRFSTLIKTSDSGKEQRNYKSTYAKYDVLVQYSELDYSDVQTLWDFYIARKGAYEAFYIYDLSLLAGTYFNHSGLYVGTGDGAEDVWDIPGRSTSSQTVYLDGISKSSPSDYSILTGGGTAGSDRIDFVAAPSEGEIITVDFTGFLRIRARFTKDSMSRELFEYNLYKIGLELTGLAAP